MIEAEYTGIAGVALLDLPRHADHRGSFTKIVNIEAFESIGLRYDFREQFFTVSKHNVLRGMHCQLPPHDHAKLVTCVAGAILDVIVDLRIKQPTFGRCVSVHLDSIAGRAVYIPSGCAHGFLTLSDEATTLYSVTSEHAPTSDAGVHWRSIEFNWPTDEPIISERDRRLPSLADFRTPF